MKPTHPSFIEALLSGGPYPHPCDEIELIETHISWVLLTGRYAYKIKKPLDLEFLDYTTLERRRICCEQELRLNRRLAPLLYLEVVPISGNELTPEIGGREEPFEYAVKMHQFREADLLSNLSARDELTAEVTDSLAGIMARFHTSIEVADVHSPYGTPQVVRNAMQNNFDAIRARCASDAHLLTHLERLEAWTKARYRALTPLIEMRRQQGFIRECHGDMHLGNIALVDGEVTVFDGIEFNPHYRWIDIVSELAFLLMDLDDRRAFALRRRTLNRYLHELGDYAGLALLRFYQVYRAMVRAKVEAIRSSQEDLAPVQRDTHVEHCQGYVDLAETYTDSLSSALVITHGPSGCGKSTLSQFLAEHTEVVWIRSDIERKRLFGLSALDRAGNELKQGIYSEQASEQTYQRLQKLAQTILNAGFPVLVDAAFLNARVRQRFKELAEDMGVAFLILDVFAEETVLRDRVETRARTGKDASDASLEVLQHQLKGMDELTPSEIEHTLRVNTEEACFPLDEIRAQCGLRSRECGS